MSRKDDQIPDTRSSMGAHEQSSRAPGSAGQPMQAVATPHGALGGPVLATFATGDIASSLNGDDSMTLVSPAVVPAMACNTRRLTNAPFSLRLPERLKAEIIDRAAKRKVAVGSYIRDVLQTEVSGTAPKRRRPKHDELLQTLAELHAAIIARGNQIAPGQLCQEQILLLKDAVAAVIELARAKGAG